MPRPVALPGAMAFDSRERGGLALRRLTAAMIVHTWYFIVTILLLLLPRQGLQFGASMIKRKHRSAAAKQAAQEPWNRRESGDPTVSFRAEFFKLRNFVDLFRAALAALSLLGSGAMSIDPSIELRPGSDHKTAITLMVIQYSLLLVGMLLQMMRFERGRFSFYPPIFYIAGLSVALSGHYAALFAFILIWTINVMMKSATAFLTIYSFLLLGFGYLLAPNQNQAIFAAGLCFLPVLLSLMSKRRLVMYSRKGTRT